MPTIYIDVLFFLNFAMNITILNAESILLRLRARPLRLIAGALLGALYSCLVFILDFKAIGSGICKIIFATLMTSTTFGLKGVGALIKRTIALFVITMGMGMLIMCLIYFTDIGIHLGGIVRKGVFYFDMPLSFMLLSCVAATAISIYMQKAFENPVMRNLVKITITHNGKSVSLTALSDTGNTLKDPISGKKVLIAEESVIKTLLTGFDFDTSTQGTANKPPAGFRLIPFSSVGEKNGLLPAFLPDKITVCGKIRKDLIVAFYNGTLSQTGDYNALISPCEAKRKDVTYA